eukprot:GHVL01025279.1.p1 GENE.GHVL01025279.1~~GHVL01025279.1.p1  ORF type:complete len:386 (+),score=59.91 GHVL01025279.1:143-1300(+)
MKSFINDGLFNLENDQSQMQNLPLLSNQHLLSLPSQLPSSLKWGEFFRRSSQNSCSLIQTPNIFQPENNTHPKQANRLYMNPVTDIRAFDTQAIQQQNSAAIHKNPPAPNLSMLSYTPNQFNISVENWNRVISLEQNPCVAQCHTLAESNICDARTTPSTTGYNIRVDSSGDFHHSNNLTSPGSSNITDNRCEYMTPTLFTKGANYTDWSLPSDISSGPQAHPFGSGHLLESIKKKETNAGLLSDYEDRFLGTPKTRHVERSFHQMSHNRTKYPRNTPPINVWGESKCLLELVTTPSPYRNRSLMADSVDKQNILNPKNTVPCSDSSVLLNKCWIPPPGHRGFDNNLSCDQSISPTPEPTITKLQSSGKRLLTDMDSGDKKKKKT